MHSKLEERKPVFVVKSLGLEGVEKICKLLTSFADLKKGCLQIHQEADGYIISTLNDYYEIVLEHGKKIILQFVEEYLWFDFYGEKLSPELTPIIYFVVRNPNEASLRSHYYEPPLEFVKSLEKLNRCCESNCISIFNQLDCAFTIYINQSSDTWENTQEIAKIVLKCNQAEMLFTTEKSGKIVR